MKLILLKAGGFLKSDKGLHFFASLKKNGMGTQIIMMVMICAHLNNHKNQRSKITL